MNNNSIEISNNICKRICNKLKFILKSVNGKSLFFLLLSIFYCFIFINNTTYFYFVVFLLILLFIYKTYKEYKLNLITNNRRINNYVIGNSSPNSDYNNNTINLEQNRNAMDYNINTSLSNMQRNLIIDKEIKKITIYVRNITMRLPLATDEEKLLLYNNLKNKLNNCLTLIRNEINYQKNTVNRLSLDTDIYSTNTISIYSIILLLKHYDFILKLSQKIDITIAQLESKIKAKNIKFDKIKASELKEITEAKTLDDCAICLQNEEAGTEYILLDCMHYFHNECISSWVQVKQRCPICTRSIT